MAPPGSTGTGASAVGAVIPATAPPGGDGMDDLHGQLLRTGRAEPADDFGFALAGGFAVQVHRNVQRLRDDVDLFTAFD